MNNWIDRMPSVQYFEVETVDGVVNIPLGGWPSRIAAAFTQDEIGFLRYQDVILGIDRRWNALMKRRKTNN